MKEIHLRTADLHKLATEVLARGDRLRFRARGNSMTPVIRHNDLVEVEPVAPDEVALGDILFLHDERGRLLLHRLIGLLSGEGGLRVLAQGDALPVADDPVSGDQILGRVVALQRRGRWSDPRAPKRCLVGKLRTLLAPYSRWLYPLARRFHLRRRT